MPDAKRKRAAGGEPEEGDYVRLTPSLAKFMGGERYRKESELTLSRLLAYERSKGRISECLQLVRVKVTTLNGKTATHTRRGLQHAVPDPARVPTLPEKTERGRLSGPRSDPGPASGCNSDSLMCTMAYFSFFFLPTQFRP